MKPVARFLVAAVSATLSLGAVAAGLVEVKFIQPQQFSDAGRTAAERERTLQALATRLRALGQRLPDGQKLTIEVSDVDLAGTVELGHHDVRVLRGRADWPRIRLAYTLESGATTLARGEETVQDMDYLNSIPRTASGDELPYEMQMLDEWFRKRFLRPSPPD